MNRLLDFSKPLDIPLLEQIVGTLYGSQDRNAVMEAQEVLTKFKATPESFFLSDQIVAQCSTPAARFFGLQIMEEGILKKWNTLTETQAGSVKSFLIQQIVAECTTTQRVRANRLLLSKLNSALVAIAKREWPSRWPSFIRDVCTSANVNEPLAENNIGLLALLAEDIFEFGEKGLTARWRERKKVALQADFELIYRFVVAAMTQSEDPVLINKALQCYTKYVLWMPLENVFDPAFHTFLSEFCVTKPALCQSAVQCLTEICGLPILAGPPGDTQRQVMTTSYRTAVQNLINQLPTQHQAIEVRVGALAEMDEAAADSLSQFVIAFLKNYIRNILHDDVLLVASHKLLIGLTHAESKETFKGCVEYWWWLGDKMLNRKGSVGEGGMSKSGGGGGAASPADLSDVVNLSTSSSLSTTFGAARTSPSPVTSSFSSAPRTQFCVTIQAKLSSILSNVRYALIRRMAKPEEVIIVEEEGEIRRESMADVETLQLYQLMRGALIFLTHLDSRDTVHIMESLMKNQLNRSEWSWKNCSSLCWAIGSISGAMSAEMEKDLFVSTMTDLLKLCKEMAGKENRAVIASNIMYVVGQYPRFLRNHTSFLRTVSRKLFEFMRELFPGVQDMAVDTFLKLTKTIPELFLEAGAEPQPFVLTILDTWGQITELLTPAHVEAMHAALGYIIAAKAQLDSPLQPDESNDARVLLMRGVERSLTEFSQAHEFSVSRLADFVADVTLLRRLVHILRVFSNTASSAGPVFIHAMSMILSAALALYTTFSTHLSDCVAASAERAFMHPGPRAMRLIKREVLKVLEQFVLNTTRDAFVAQSIMPSVFEFVLTDYLRAHPLNREAGALALVTACVKRLRSLVASETGAILDHTFGPTIELILANMADFPEHRVQLFKLLFVLQQECFEQFVEYLSRHEDVVSSILWAIKHTEQGVMTTGLELLHSILVRVLQCPLAESFYVAFTPRILTEVLVCAMDTLHTHGFPLQCSILAQLFLVSRSVPEDLPGIGRQAVQQFLMASFQEVPTLVPEQSALLVTQCYQLCDQEGAFRQLLADFLVEVQIWGAAQENALLREEEQRERELAMPELVHSAALRPDYARFQQSMDDAAV